MPAYHGCVWCPWRQKRTLDPGELELKLVVSHLLDPGTRTYVLYKNSKCSLND